MKYLVLAALVSLTLSSHAQSNWKWYRQHGYNLELPDYFLPVAPQDGTTDVFVNSNNKDILLKVESSPSDQLSFNSKYLTEVASSGITYKLIKGYSVHS